MTPLSQDLERHACRYYGKYSGDVVSTDDPDHTGRLQVTVPSVLTPDVLVWARPCFGSGHFFVPPVGAKVWVEFEAGNVGYPLWVGTWYPTGSVVAQADKKDAVGRVVHTPSGHVIELSDEQGDEKVVITHSGGSSISIDKDGSVLVTGRDGAKLEILDGEVKISGPKTVTLEATSLKLSGTTVDLGSGGQAAVLGQGLMSMFNAHTHPSAMGPTGTPLPPMVPGAPVFSSTVTVQP